MIKNSKIRLIKEGFKNYYLGSNSEIIDNMFSNRDHTQRKLSSFKILLSHLLFVLLLKILIYNFILENNEYLWDLVILGVANLSLLFTFRGLSKMNLRHHFFTSIFFILYYIQVVYSSINNDYGELYLLEIFLTTLFIPVITFRTSLNEILKLVFVLMPIFYYSRLSVNYTPSQQKVALIILAATYVIMLVRRYLISDKEGASIHSDFLGEILSRSEMAIFLTDFEGVIFDSNARASKFFNYTKEEFRGTNFSTLRKDQLTYEEDMSGLNEIFHDRFWRSDVSLVKKDGTEFIAYVSVSLIRRKEGNYLIYRVKDITSEKMAEELLKRERDKAEAAVKAKSLFLATMSHEIRTPMNGVIGMSRILAHTDLSVDQRDYVSTILRSGESLISIINDILDFSKIEAQKIMIENRAFNLQDLLTDVLKLYNPLTNEKDLNFSLKIGANVPRVVVGDSLRLKQVINNLVNNAIKFTESGFIHLLVDKIDYDENSWTIRFEVKDSGVGIPKNKVSILFDSFSQVDASDSRKFGGTGLGLAICKGLVELMNGDIEVESEVGKGSSFIFNLKFDVSNKEVSNADNEEILDKKLERLKPGELKILLAEDNLVNQKVASLIFQQMGIEIDCATNGFEAIEMCEENDYDIVFMDIQMPEMDGIEATRRLFNENLISSPSEVLAMTANVLDEDRKKCFEVGMSGFLSKPIDTRELKEALLYYLENKKEYVS